MLEEPENLNFWMEDLFRVGEVLCITVKAGLRRGYEDISESQ
jgi:hypothetical protein